MATKRIPVLENFAWQPPVLSILNDPPGAPSIGDRHLIGTSPTGDWVGRANHIAWRDATSWHYDIPEKGWRVYVDALDVTYRFNSTAWIVDGVDGDFIPTITTPTAGNVPTVDAQGELDNGYGVSTDLENDSDLNLKLPRADATKTYIDNVLAALDAKVYKGTIDCSGNPNYPAADAGHLYTVSVAGKIGGASGISVRVNDEFFCLADDTAAGDHATVGANWYIRFQDSDTVVRGPAGAVSDRIVLFDGVSGKIIKDSALPISDVTGHMADDTKHFTQGEIDHANILNKGTFTHANIDTHIGTHARHRLMTYSAALQSIIYEETNETF